MDEQVRFLQQLMQDIDGSNMLILSGIVTMLDREDALKRRDLIEHLLEMRDHFADRGAPQTMMQMLTKKAVILAADGTCLGLQ